MVMEKATAFAAGHRSGRPSPRRPAPIRREDRHRGACGPIRARTRSNVRKLRR